MAEIVKKVVKPTYQFREMEANEFSDLVDICKYWIRDHSAYPSDQGPTPYEDRLTSMAQQIIQEGKVQRG